MRNKHVLILDACQRSALAVTRSLGSKGVTVITADETGSALAGYSRYSRKYCTYASPRDARQAFKSDLIDICREYDIDIVLPMTELTAAVVMDFREELKGVILPFANRETVNSLADKCSLMRLAQSLDVPTPTTRYMQPNDVFIMKKSQSFPLVMKPGKSWMKINGVWVHTCVRIADTESKALEILANDPAFRTDAYMLQEYIPGTGAGVFALYDHGEPLAFFAHKRLREKPPRGGVSVVSESATIDPVLRDFAQKLLDAVKWHGVAMVEFRISEDGRPYLMEINTRFWGSLQLAVDAGADFPWLLYLVTCEQPVQALTSYKTGQKLRWLLGDLDSLYLLLRDPTYTIREKLRATTRFLAIDPLKTRHEVNRWDDLRPFQWELKKYLKDLVS